MSKSIFSERELNLIKYYSVHQPLIGSLIFFFCVLAAPIGFAIYGFLSKDTVAMLVAFGGLLVFIVWYIYSAMKNEKAINNIFNKILDNEFSN